MARTLFEEVFERAEVERARRASSKNLITRDECQAEISPMGVQRWYLHPRLDTPSTQALYFHELEIPVGSRSGKLFCQGGIVHLVLEGEGYTEVDGERHSWEAEDLIAIPIREYGVTYQHVNTGSTPVRMVVAWPNLDSAIGPEGGVEMKVLENAPEFEALLTTSAS
ncbi:MAG: cupin domain-containing protein [Chloroflexi bacterium]|nr:cupin domain-containing protein [Chloroflexota bacterium]